MGSASGRVNVFARDQGWLFEDLKHHASQLGLPDIEIAVSNEPLDDADAWVALRTIEGGATPNAGHTLVCIHDLFAEDGLYLLGGPRQCVHACGALALCHPQQRVILEQARVNLTNRSILDRPLGALRIFTPRSAMSERFCIGWVGKNHPRKRLPWLVQAVRQLAPDGCSLQVDLIGKDLSEAAAAILECGIACRNFSRDQLTITDYPPLYQQLDCVVITGETEAGPLPLFEALASGVPVVSTPVGWAPHFATLAPQYVRLADSPEEISVRLAELRRERQSLFERRLQIAELVRAFKLDDWLAEAIRMAAALRDGNSASAR